MTNVEMLLRLKELDTEMDKIRKRLEHWKSCQDGSYEMALHYTPFYKMLDEKQAIIKEMAAEAKRNFENEEIKPTQFGFDL